MHSIHTQILKQHSTHHEHTNIYSQIHAQTIKYSKSYIHAVKYGEYLQTQLNTVNTYTYKNKLLYYMLTYTFLEDLSITGSYSP